MDTPKIATTLGALADAEAALVKILAVKFDHADGARVRYHVVKLAKLVSVETRHFYDERNALIAKHGESNQIGPASPKWTDFRAELKALSEVPATIAWGPLTDAMVEPYAEITAADLVGLGPLYELDQETHAAPKKPRGRG